MPFEAMAKIGRQDDWKPAAPEPEVTEEITSKDTSQEEERLAEILKWNTRRNATFHFWEKMMNNRAPTKSYRTKATERREKRKQLRIQCRTNMRKANRDTKQAESERCMETILKIDMEELRQQKQRIVDMAGVTNEAKNIALFHTDNLMEAIASILAYIEQGAYGPNDLANEVRNLSTHYRQMKRISMTRLRISRAQTWLKHLMVRLRDIEEELDPAPEVIVKIGEVITCLEQKGDLFSSLSEVEDNSALIVGFRQAQSEVKFCIDLARESKKLNTELEQAEAENS